MLSELQQVIADTDEQYVFDLCDKVLGISSSRIARFHFPVNAYYEDYKLFVVYCEKPTINTEIFLKKYNIQPVEICFSDFSCDKQNKIIRNTASDIKVVRRKLTMLS